MLHPTVVHDKFLLSLRVGTTCLLPVIYLCVICVSIVIWVGFSFSTVCYFKFFDFNSIICFKEKCVL